MTAHDGAAKAVKEAESRLSDLSLLMKHSTTYRQLRPLYEQYRNPRTRKSFAGHEGEIILFEAAAKQLKQMGVAKLPELEKLKREYATLNDRKAALYEEYRKAKSR